MAKSHEKWILKYAQSADQSILLSKSPEEQFEIFLNYLDQAHISIDEYLEWASENYQAPYVDPEFFSQVDLSALFKQLGPKFKWSANLIPLDLSDTQLTVGCLIPPADNIDLPYQIQLAIVHPENLKNSWEVLEKYCHVTHSNPSHDAPSGLLIDFSNIPSSTQSFEIPKNIENTFSNLHTDSAQHTNSQPINSHTSQTGLSKKMSLERHPKNTKREFQECTSIEEAADLMFVKMQEYYEMQMLLVYQGESFIPWLWSGDFHPTDVENILAVDLLHASIFRIACTSQKPYHGKVIANPTNNEFFRQWFNSKIPSLVSIVPIIIHKKVVGCWFGATDGEASQKIDARMALQDFEAWTKESQESLTKTLDADAA